MANAVLGCTAMGFLQSIAVSGLLSMLRLFYRGWYVAVLVLLYKIWRRLDRLPS